MPRIVVETEINASPSRCFDLTRDIDLHQEIMRHTDEEAIGGRTTGLIELGERVTWRAKHFGIYHTHTAEITEFDRPNHFCDEMTEGRFKYFRHDHAFDIIGGRTLMTDTLVFRSPLGLLGFVVDSLVLKRYFRRLLLVRGEFIRQVAESRSEPERG